MKMKAALAEVKKFSMAAVPPTPSLVHELIEDYILICYDIPAKEKALRYKFLKDAEKLGAMQHTESVYLLPYSETSFEMAKQLEAAGHAVIWVSKQKDMAKVQEITLKYYDYVKLRCAAIEQRFSITQDHIAAGRLIIAKKMITKTGRLLQELVKIAEYYEAAWLKPKIEELFAKYKEVYQDYE